MGGCPFGGRSGMNVGLEKFMEFVKKWVFFPLLTMQWTFFTYDNGLFFA